MTHITNIAGADGSVMVPVLTETGSLMAYLLYPNPAGVLQDYYPCKAIPREYLGNSQAIPRQYYPEGGSDAQDYVHPPLSNLHKWKHELFSWASQLSIQSFKTKKMETTSSKGVTADRIKNDPLFERTRENMAEFTRAGKAAKLLRGIFREVTINARDKITQARLTQLFSRIINTDGVSARGERTVNNGDLLQLQSFNFNERAGIGDILYVRCPVTINRVTGEVQVSIPAFVPRTMVKGAPGTTHFRIVAAAAAINFETGNYEHALQETAELPWDHDPTAATALNLTLPANSLDTIVVALGLELYQRVNARSYALKTGEYNAATIVKVDLAA